MNSLIIRQDNRPRRRGGRSAPPPDEKADDQREPGTRKLTDKIRTRGPNPKNVISECF